MIQLGQEAQSTTTIEHIGLPLSIDDLNQSKSKLKSAPFLVRSHLTQAVEQLDQAFWNGACVIECLAKRSELIDDALKLGWSWCKLDQLPMALVAVGGYGRRHLHPQSDVDILLLTNIPLSKKQNRQIEKFIAYGWDCGLNIGHSVRTLAECKQLAEVDVTILSSMLDARYIDGHKDLFDSLHATLFHSLRHNVPLEHFFSAKMDERAKRYQRYGHTEYTLEPNLKECPGGLRDIQILGLFTKREFGTHDLDVLLTIGFITTEEKEALFHAQYTLWQIRYALHLTANKCEDRLFLDYQEKLSRQFGFKQETINDAISSFMLLFFRAIRTLREITSVLFQHFRELYRNDTCEQYPLNEFAKIQDQSICITDEQHLQQNPHHVLILFETLAQRPKLRGFVARSTRFIVNFYQNHPLVANAETRPLFLKLFEYPLGTAKALRLMARFGLLSQYCPDFEKTIGQMQYDLYHVYTVDAHILNMLEHIQDFYVDCSDLTLVEKALSHHVEPICLYLGALFHDIGKGRGGNHSIIGCEIAQRFCNEHHLDHSQTQLISWLVKEHLTFSNTARTKDLSSPDVVSTFCETVQNRKYLDHLYVLTIADIRATNPTLWNKWQESLLKNLYTTACQFLGDDQDYSAQDIVKASQKQALSILKQFEIPHEAITELWSHIGDEYFQTESCETIAWHTQELHQSQNYPIISLKPHAAHGSTEIFIFAPDRAHLFALCTATLDKLQLSVVQARIITSMNGYCMNTFVVLESSGLPISSPQRKFEIQHTLTALVKPLIKDTQVPPKIPFVSHRIRRQLKFFKHQAKVTLTNNEIADQSVLVVLAPDFPGLLARLGEAFIACDVFVCSAKINTLGKRVEDVFYITDRQTRKPITDNTSILHLKSAILDKLSQYWT